MTDVEIRMLAKYIVEESNSDGAVLDKIISVVVTGDKSERRLVSAKKAAEILGISTSLLYKTKCYPDGRPILTCMKLGSNKSNILRYDANKIVLEWEAYAAWKRRMKEQAGM